VSMSCRQVGEGRGREDGYQGALRANISSSKQGQQPPLLPSFPTAVIAEREMCLTHIGAAQECVGDVDEAGVVGVQGKGQDLGTWQCRGQHKACKHEHLWASSPGITARTPHANSLVCCLGLNDMVLRAGRPPPPL
jgi:hypothetical protein